VPPAPALGPGLHEGDRDERAGRLSLQPILADGTRLDDVTGTRFVVATTRDLHDTLPEDLKQALDDDGDVVTLLDPSKVADLLASVSAAALVIRPDHYILGVADTATDLERLIRTIPSLARISTVLS
jgi:3-(3-hydroxy-phenyl)propionate hydroxylase